MQKESRFYGGIVMAILVLRIVLLWWQPFSNELFSQNLLVVNDWTPSLGDQTLNALSWAGIVYLVYQKISFVNPLYNKAKIILLSLLCFIISLSNISYLYWGSENRLSLQNIVFQGINSTTFLPIFNSSIFCVCYILVFFYSTLWFVKTKFRVLYLIALCGGMGFLATIIDLNYLGAESSFAVIPNHQKLEPLLVQTLEKLETDSLLEKTKVPIKINQLLINELQQKYFANGFEKYRLQVSHTNNLPDSSYKLTHLPNVFLKDLGYSANKAIQLRKGNNWQFNLLPLPNTNDKKVLDSLGLLAILWILYVLFSLVAVWIAEQKSSPDTDKGFDSSVLLFLGSITVICLLLIAHKESEKKAWKVQSITEHAATLLQWSKGNESTEQILDSLYTKGIFAKITDQYNNIEASNYSIGMPLATDKTEKHLEFTIAKNKFLKIPVVKNLPKDYYSQAKNTFLIWACFLLFLALLVWNSLKKYYEIKDIALLQSAFNAIQLEEKNIPLAWENDTEMGKLALAHNAIVDKIEESKFSISQKEKNQAWGDIAKQVAHEIKNPLTPMVLNLQHMQRNLADGNMPTAAQLSKRIDGLLVGLNEVAAISDSFATFAKMPIPALNSTNLYKVYQQIEALYLGQDSIKFHTKLAPISVVQADETQLIQIINNLIINAIQACKNVDSPLIELFFIKEKHQYIIQVTDNGTGIDTAIIDKIFLPNFSTKSAGSGVGLAFARWAIENFNGQLKAENNQTAGASFFVYLPA
jgi:signal transduction histidine kinase